MRSELLAESVATDGTRRVTLLTRADGARFLQILGVRTLARMPANWTRDDLATLATWLVNRPEPMKDTIVQLLKEMGSIHVQ